MKKTVLFAMITLIGIILFSCESKSGKKVRNSNLEQPASIPNEAENLRPIIGVPKSVTHSIDLKRWQVSLDRGFDYAQMIDIDSASAMQIITDKTIIAVKVQGKEITLLRE